MAECVILAYCIVWNEDG